MLIRDRLKRILLLNSISKWANIWILWIWILLHKGTTLKGFHNMCQEKRRNFHTASVNRDS